MALSGAPQAVPIGGHAFFNAFTPRPINTAVKPS
jgi:hypothetical protein